MKILIELEVEDAKNLISTFDYGLDNHCFLEDCDFDSAISMAKLVSVIKTKIALTETQTNRPKTIEDIFVVKAEEALEEYLKDDGGKHPYDDLESIVSLHTFVTDMNTGRNDKPSNMIYGFLKSNIKEIKCIEGDQQFLWYVASLSDEEYEMLSFWECIDFWVGCTLTEGRG